MMLFGEKPWGFGFRFHVLGTDFTEPAKTNFLKK